MKNNKFARIALSAALALTLLVRTGIALAQPEPEESEVDINFQEGNAVVPPVDPDDPSKPLEPGGGGTGQSGPLALNYISPITFGQQYIFSTEKTYNATTMKPFVQVTDLRGTGKGWRVTAKASPFTNEQGGQSLLGSTITFERGEAVSAYDDLDAPVPVQLVELPTNGITELNVVRANTDEGIGTWVTRWYPSAESPDDENDSVTLTVLPGRATPGKHTTRIVWTLISDVVT